MRPILYKILFIIKDNIINILRSFISSFGILFLVIFFVVYMAVKDSVTAYISGSLLDRLASNEIKILPGGAKGIEFVKRPGSQGISVKTLARIREMKEFTELNAISRAGFNVRIKGEMLGQSKAMYVPTCGIDRRLIKDKVPGWGSFHNRKPVPVIIPTFSIDIMNNFMSMNNMQTLTEKDFIGFPIELKFIMGKKKTPQYKEYTHNAEIHSFTDIINFPGIILPTDFLTEVSAQYSRESGKSSGFEYIVVYAKAKDTDRLPSIVSSLKKMGLKVESQKDITEKTQKTMRVIDGVFYAIMGIFFIVSAISIFNSYLTIVYIRSQKFSLKRVLGFSKIGILIAFVFEAAFIGALYGVAGYFCGNYIISHAGEFMSKWVPVLGVVKFQAKGSDVLLMCVGLSAAVSAASAFVPAIFASNINLFKAVRK